MWRFFFFWRGVVLFIFQRGLDNLHQTVYNIGATLWGNSWHVQIYDGPTLYCQMGWWRRWLPKFFVFERYLHFASFGVELDNTACFSDQKVYSDFGWTMNLAGCGCQYPSPIFISNALQIAAKSLRDWKESWAVFFFKVCKALKNGKWVFFREKCCVIN